MLLSGPPPKNHAVDVEDDQATLSVVSKEVESNLRLVSEFCCRQVRPTLSHNINVIVIYGISGLTGREKEMK